MKGTVIVTWRRSGSTMSARAAELLDDAEDVVPAAGVETRGVLAQLEQDLLHLEGGEDRLDQDGGADRAARDAEGVLGGDEDLVPQRRLEVALELRQVEVRAAAARQQLAARCGRTRPRSRRCWQSPARRRRAGAPRRGASPAAGRRASRCGPPGRRPCSSVSKVSVRRTASSTAQLARDHVRPGGGEGVLEVGHEDRWRRS